MKIRIPLLAVAMLAIAAPTGAAAAPTAHSAATCSDYSNQADAQRAADTRDTDGDGVYCEALPCPCLKPGQGGGGGGGNTPAPKPKKKRKAAQRIVARVTKVTDGDTIKVKPLEKTSRKSYTVRVIGIDTPEVFGGVECGGREASASMKRLAPVGSKVLLRTDPSQATFDRYDRLLAYVQRKGRDVGRSQVSAGWAKVYVFAAKPFRRTSAYRRSAAAAKAAKRGVWGACGGNFHSKAQ